jgi:hypothetical protein
VPAAATERVAEHLRVALASPEEQWMASQLLDLLIRLANLSLALQQDGGRALFVADATAGGPQGIWERTTGAALAAHSGLATAAPYAAFISNERLFVKCTGGLTLPSARGVQGAKTTQKLRIGEAALEPHEALRSAAAAIRLRSVPLAGITQKGILGLQLPMPELTQEQQAAVERGVEGLPEPLRQPARDCLDVGERPAEVYTALFNFARRAPAAKRAAPTIRGAAGGRVAAAAQRGGSEAQRHGSAYNAVDGGGGGGSGGGGAGIPAGRRRKVNRSSDSSDSSSDEGISISGCCSSSGTSSRSGSGDGSDGESGDVSSVEIRGGEDLSSGSSGEEGLLLGGQQSERRTRRTTCWAGRPGAGQRCG